MSIFILGFSNFFDRLAVKSLNDVATSLSLFMSIYDAMLLSHPVNPLPKEDVNLVTALGNPLVGTNPTIAYLSAFLSSFSDATDSFNKSATFFASA